MFSQQQVISKIEELFIPEGKPPRYRAINEEVIHLEKPTSCLGGVLVNNAGEVLALWASYSSSDKKSPGSSYEIFRGMPCHLFESSITAFRNSVSPNSMLYLEAEWWPMTLSKARDLGLDDKWIKEIEQTQSKRHILCVRRLVARSDCANKLKTGDVLIAINGKIITTFQDVERETADKESVELTILRTQQEIKVTVELSRLSGEGTSKVLCWSGAILQNTHKAVAQLGFLYDGVYCSRWYYGSPAHKYNLRAVHWITEVNGTPTPDVDAFVAVVKDLPDGSSLRLKMVGVQDKVMVTTIKIDLHYWPTWLLHKEGTKWKLKAFDKQAPAIQNAPMDIQQ